MESKRGRTASHTAFIRVQCCCRIAASESCSAGVSRSSCASDASIRSGPWLGPAAASARRAHSARPPAPTAIPATKVATRSTTAHVLERLSMTACPAFLVSDDGGEHHFDGGRRSEEHTSESSHSQISYAVFCLKKKKKKTKS